MNKINISVIIPCYNAEKTIIKCLDSVIRQTRTVDEIICIDDGSTDQTLMMLNSYKDCYDGDIELIVLSQVNSGPSVARNRGISISKGNWIAFLDSDDYWDENKIKHQESFLEQHQQAKLIGSASLRNQTFIEVSFSALLRKNYFQTSSVIVDKKVMKENLFNEEQKYSEDYRSWLGIVSKYQAFVVFPVMAHQVFPKRVFGDNGLSSKLWEMQKGEISNFKYLLRDCKIKWLHYFCLFIHSYLKFFRRIIISNLNEKNN